MAENLENTPQAILNPFNYCGLILFWRLNFEMNPRLLVVVKMDAQPGRL